MRILVVEDERKVRNFIQQALEQSGMTVDAISSISELIPCLETSLFDAIVLDRLLEGKDSLSSVIQIRRRFPKIKILVLSALSDIEEKVHGLTEGADDYLGKPFHVSELIARIRSLTRRSDQWEKGGKDTVLVYQDLKVDLENQRVFRNEKLIELTGKEFRLLILFMRNPGKIFSKSHLLDKVWNLNQFPESNVVEVTIANLRAKIDKGFNPFIQSRRGVGYWLGEP